MSKQNQAVETKTGKQNRPRATSAAVREQSPPEPAVPVDMSSSGLSSVAGDGSVEVQSARLADHRFQVVQRRAMAARIGQVQGNNYLRRVLALLKSKPANGTAGEQGGNPVASTAVQLSPLSVELEQILITQGRDAFFNRLSGLSVSDQDVADFVEQTFRGDELRLARHLLHVVPPRNDPAALSRVRLEHLFDLYTTLECQYEPPELGGNLYDYGCLNKSRG